MATISWPVGLPTPRLDGYQIQLGDQLIQSKMDKGPAKQRALADWAPDRVQCSINMTRTQFNTLRTWYRVDLKGGAREFNWFDYIGNNTWEARFIPGQGPTAVSDGHPDSVTVMISLELMV